MSRQIPAALARLLPERSSVAESGELAIGGCSTRDLVEEFGTPLFVYDEDALRETMRRYRDGLTARWPRSRICFASKALPCVAAYAIAQSEGISVDVVGEGELRLALAAGVDPSRIVLHGNAKSLSELALAVAHRVGLVVVDNLADIEMLESIGGSQDILIRVIPEIDADTHPSIATGGKGAKFGLPMAETVELVQRLRTHNTIRVRGVHLHLGSQILDTAPFALAVRTLAGLGDFDIFNIGGGLGVNYSERDDAPSIESYLDSIVATAGEVLPEHAEILLEPGRSLVARSGVTLYTVRNVKASYRTFVAVDGGMSELMSIALTEAPYRAAIANRIADEPDTTAQLVGRQCESGDLLVDRAALAAPSAGDTVVIAATGAYGYTFVNNYNGALHAPVVFCSGGTARLAVERQSYDALLAPHRPALSENWASRAQQPAAQTPPQHTPS